MWTGLAAWQKALIVVLVIVGIVAIAVGAVYIAVPAHSLPHWFPAHAARGDKHATKHGVAALVLGAVLLILAWIVQVSAKRARAW
jgi:hypothetical protein